MRRRRFLAVAALALPLIAAATVFAWSSLPSDRSGEWTLTQLEGQARQGRVSELDVRGMEAVAVDRDGRRWTVHLPADNSAIVQRVIDDGVNVRYESTAPGTVLSVAISGLIIVLLGAGILGIVYFALRRRRR